MKMDQKTRKRKYNMLTVAQKNLLVKLAEAGISNQELAVKFNVTEGAVRYALKKKIELAKRLKTLQDLNIVSKKKVRGVEENGLEKCLYNWCRQRSERNKSISGPLIKAKAKWFNAKLNGSPDFKASNGWLAQFKKRHGIRGSKIPETSNDEERTCLEIIPHAPEVPPKLIQVMTPTGQQLVLLNGYFRNALETKPELCDSLKPQEEQHESSLDIKREIEDTIELVEDPLKLDDLDNPSSSCESNKLVPDSRNSVNHIKCTVSEIPEGVLPKPEPCDSLEPQEEQHESSLDIKREIEDTIELVDDPIKIDDLDNPSSPCESNKLVPESRNSVNLIKCTVSEIPEGGVFLVQSTEFIVPAMPDQCTAGKVACASVLSTLYAMGITNVCNILLMLGNETEMSKTESEAVWQIINGIKNAATIAGVQVHSKIILGQSCAITQIATAVCNPNQYIVPDKAEDGDLLVLTKPLGTQIALHAYDCLLNNPQSLEDLDVSAQDINEAYKLAIENMLRLNHIASQLMHKYNAHAAIDIKNLGLIGHANILVKQQKREVSFLIQNLPYINAMDKFERDILKTNNLFKGISAEVSGGLLICLPKEGALNFCTEIEQLDDYQAWVVGKVSEGPRFVQIKDKFRRIAVCYKN